MDTTHGTYPILGMGRGVSKRQWDFSISLVELEARPRAIIHIIRHRGLNSAILSPDSTTSLLTFRLALLSRNVRVLIMMPEAVIEPEVIIIIIILEPVD